MSTDPRDNITMQTPLGKIMEQRRKIKMNPIFKIEDLILLLGFIIMTLLLVINASKG